MRPFLSSTVACRTTSLTSTLMVYSLPFFSAGGVWGFAGCGACAHRARGRTQEEGKQSTPDEQVSAVSVIESVHSSQFESIPEEAATLWAGSA